MESLGSRLRGLRVAKDETQQDIANLLGVVRETVTQWERGEHSPSVESLKVLAQHFKVSIDYLAEGKDPIRKMAEIPVVGTIKTLPVLSEENIIAKIEVPADMVRDGDYYQLIVHEDSMIGANIKEGYRVLVRDQDKLEDGQIGLISIGDSITLRRVYTTNGGYLLMAANPNYTERKVSASDIKILGRVRVVWFEV